MSNQRSIEGGRIPYDWATRGDLNAFFGLMIDNVSGLIITTSILTSVFEIPGEFILTRMIPGTAIGVLVGDLLFAALAFRLASKRGRGGVTAMPLGLDTPSVFGTSLLIVGPAFKLAEANGLSPDQAATHAWYIGITMLFFSGILKVVCAGFSGWIRRVLPRAGLLGSLAAIALVVISFLPLLDVISDPIPGLAALAVILMSLTARWKLPKAIPGALGALVVGLAVYYGLRGIEHLVGLPGPIEEPKLPAVPFPGIPWPLPGWWDWIQENWREAFNYLPIALPLALATVVGGIDCTESAAAAGDEYSTGQIIVGEGIATLIAALFGGVIQTTPYIGQPAYKAMGGRAAYTIATALFVGAAGTLGFFSLIFQWIPKEIVSPILLFVALEITAQSFAATPRKHYPALAIAVIPALAYLTSLLLKQVLNDPALSGLAYESLLSQTRQSIEAVTMLAGGFILTSLLWSTSLARMIDGRFRSAAITIVITGILALFGVIHSPMPDERVMLPGAAISQMEANGRLETSEVRTPYHWAIAYGVSAVIVFVIGQFGAKPTPEEPEVHPPSTD